ncbi:hypothetical protein E1757_13275 [Paenibacillus piri]|uniref:SCP domain-containing protein n=2 Tax=Paenibacillus piri TaxID=2547395 RepID=A0A4R5KSE3_9BACL|nr:hypothetical protein E1757_13275 [Paenibacillus piri]
MDDKTLESLLWAYGNAKLPPKPAPKPGPQTGPTPAPAPSKPGPQTGPTPAPAPSKPGPQAGPTPAPAPSKPGPQAGPTPAPAPSKPGPQAGPIPAPAPSKPPGPQTSPTPAPAPHKPGPQAGPTPAPAPSKPGPQTGPTPAPTPAPEPAPIPLIPGELSSEERQMVELINQARKDAGLAPLIVNAELSKTARMKSRDMADHNYFSHQSPTYGSPLELIKKFGISYASAEENIACNQTVMAAQLALMNSSSQRANILSKDFTEIGVGIADGGSCGKMFTQQFIRK